MQLKALDYLACPHCGGELALQSASGDEQEILEGSLQCRADCGTYPIQSGVPRLLPELVRSENASECDVQAHTGASFGNQWEMFRYGSTTWGITEEERIDIVLHELNWKREDLRGKTILDAGCGNGTLSRALVDLGATVVALDLSNSVFRAYEHRNAPGLHFVQGNLFFPPLKPGVFDAIYSCGVFHHTPDTRRCFDALVPTLKTDPSARYFVWLYAKRHPLFQVTVEPLMSLTRRLPSWALVPTCKVLSPPVEAASRALTTLGILEQAPRTRLDRAIQLHDLLSPRYVWYIDYEDTHDWAQNSGFRTIVRTDYAPENGDVTPEMARLLRKYRSVSRPGFGIRCQDRQAETANGEAPR